MTAQGSVSGWGGTSTGAGSSAGLGGAPGGPCCASGAFSGATDGSVTGAGATGCLSFTANTVNGELFDAVGSFTVRDIHSEVSKAEKRTKHFNT